MAQLGQNILVQTDPTTQFRAALATNAALTLNLLPGQGIGKVDPGLSALPSCKGRLQSIGVQSVENLAWEIWLWGTDGFNTVAQALQRPLGRWSFVEADGLRIAGTGLYYYYIEGLDHFYVDWDQTGELHLMLVNRSVASKSADDAGAILLAFGFQPTLGY